MQAKSTILIKHLHPPQFYFHQPECAGVEGAAGRCTGYRMPCSLQVGWNVALCQSPKTVLEVGDRFCPVNTEFVAIYNNVITTTEKTGWGWGWKLTISICV